jgi:hypothetical protein
VRKTQPPASGRHVQRPVEIHIEELVLHGFGSGDRRRIANAVQQELVRLMTAQTLPASRENQLSLDRIQGGTFRVSPGSKPHAIGSQIARAVHRNLRLQAITAASAAALTQLSTRGRQP